MSCEWLTVQEVANALKVTTDAVHRWIRLGQLDYSRTPGGERRVCRADLVQPGRKGPPMNNPSMATVHRALDKESE